VTEKGVTNLRHLVTKSAGARSKLLEKEATISAQAAEVEQLRERLRMIEAAPSAP